MTDTHSREDMQGNEGVPTTGYGAGSEGPGAVIGRYKLLRILGEGGYGIVYLAEQQRPVKRRVALNGIKPGIDYDNGAPDWLGCIEDDPWMGQGLQTMTFIGQWRLYTLRYTFHRGLGRLNTYAIVDAMNGAMSSIPAVPSGVYVKRRSQIERPGERMVFVDEGKTSTQSWTIFYDRSSWWELPPVRHGQSTNFSFADGHAEYWKWEDMRTVKVARQEGNWQSLVNAPGNPDIQRVQRAAWGQLGYTP